MPLLGYRRVTSGNACAFCSMLASRGAVYSQRGASFEAHDGCSCSPEPVWDIGPEPEEVTRLRKLWRESTAGLSGKDALNAFRRALSGRPARTARAAVSDTLGEIRKRFVDRVKTAVRGDAALRSAPAQLERGLDAFKEVTARAREEMRHALIHYRGTAYEDINDFLRLAAGDPDVRAPNSEVRHFVDRINQAMGLSRLPVDVVLFRGIVDGRKLLADPALWEKSLDGLEFVSWAFSSATTEPAVAAQFAGTDGDSVIMTILAPRGMSAIQMSDFDFEAEILLPQGLRYRVVNDRGVVDNVRRLDVEVTQDD